MDFTFFSLFAAIIWVSIFAKIASRLRKQMLFLRYFSICPLMILLFFSILRLFLAIELPYTKIVNSKKILSTFQSFVCTPFFTFGKIKISLIIIGFVVWFSVAVSILIKHMVDYYRLKRSVDFFPPATDKHLYKVISKLDLHGRLSDVKIIVHQSVLSPAVIGFIKPIIILPPINFTDDELFGIYIHECTHYKKGHLFIKCITEVICAFFWWNPFFKDLSMEVAHILELHSDKSVCKILDKNQQKVYLQSISRVMNNMVPSYLPPPSCSLVEENNVEKLQQRFQMILEGNYNNKKNRDFIIIPLIVLFFMFSYSFVFQPYSEPSTKAFGAMNEIHDGDYLIKTNDGYALYNSSDEFIASIKYIDQSLDGLKIYNSRKDVK